MSKAGRFNLWDAGKDNTVNFQRKDLPICEEHYGEGHAEECRDGSGVFQEAMLAGRPPMHILDECTGETNPYGNRKRIHVN